jgi:hypothetical protein
MRIAFASLVIVSVLLVGCGGGGNDGAVDDTAPQISSLTADRSMLWLGAVTAVRCEATDPAGGSLEYTWSCDGGLIEGTGSAVTWRAPAVATACEIECRVENEAGQSATRITQVSCANAQVEGTVVDVGSGAGLASVQVTIAGKSGTTDAAGEFTVQNIGEGQHTVNVTPPATCVIVSDQMSVSVAEPGSTVRLEAPIQLLDTGVPEPPDTPDAPGVPGLPM